MNGNEVVLKFVKLTDKAQIPMKAHEGDSGFDIRSVETGFVGGKSVARFKTGIAAIIPKGYELQVRPRSGLAHKFGVMAAFGTIDSGYRGDIGIALYNMSDSKFVVNEGDRIAQLVISKVPDLKVEEGTLDELEETERGSDGFGSTGVK